MSVGEIKWDVGTLRATAFSPSQISAQNWWQELWGEQPEVRQQRPQDLVQQESGVSTLGPSVLTIGPGRIDWIVKAGEDDEPASAFPVLGPMDELFSGFQKAILQWLDSDTSPELTRLAFSAELFKSVESREVGYRLLDAYLPCLEIDVENSSDLIYQINRRRPSKSGPAGIEMNRVSRWMIATKTSGALGIEGHKVSFNTSPAAFACNLLIETNTIPQGDATFDRASTQEICEELVALGREIATDGDVK